MAPGFITDPSVVLCGYGCLPALPGMTLTLIEIIWDFSTFSAVSAYLWNVVLFEGIGYLQNRREHCGGKGVTYKVRSLGMWLKLETGMLLMLLLFSVL